MSRFNRALAATAVISLLSLLTAGAPAQSLARPSQRWSAKPVQSLPDPAGRWSGKAAITHLGSRLPAVAARAGMTATKVRDIFTSDKTLHVDGNDRLLYVDPPVPSSAALPSASAVLDTSYPEDTFLLHSLPGATRIIYLDFNGHWISGFRSARVGGECYAEPYSSDEDETTFNGWELGRVQNIWRRVSEDFAPFNVDVTTQDPEDAALSRDSISDVNYGTRAVITGSILNCPNGKTLYESVCPDGCGGLSYLGVYGLTGASRDYLQPPLIFQNGVSEAPKDIAEVISHEVGHNIGLSHDGTATAEYYVGQGSWAPIMGIGYNKPITQWSKGEYTGANNREDDFAVMGTHGLPLRTDDYGNTAATAHNVGSAPATIDGVISTAVDVDVFSFNVAAAGATTFTAIPATWRPNLDIKLTLKNGAGTVVASNNPASGRTNDDVAFGMSASIAWTPRAAGIYTLTVDGVGAGTAASTGYSDYGSLGNYRISTTFNLAPIARVTAVPTSGFSPLVVAFDGSTSYDPEFFGELSFAWTFGTGTTTSNLVNPSFTYTAVGTYYATLNVIDSLGLWSRVAARKITVWRPMDISALTVSGVKETSPSTATATIAVQDAKGGAVAGAAVAGNWYKGTTLLSKKTQTTTTTGTATSSSGAITVIKGDTLRFCVTGVTLAGAKWDPTIYAPTTRTDCVVWTVP